MILSAFFIASCARIQEDPTSGPSGELIIFHAGSLTLPVERLSSAFEDRYPGVDVLSEAAGSRTTARKVSELQRQADLVMSADYQVIDSLLIPEHASWNIQFATNAMVVIYSDLAAYAEEINSENWYQVLTREDVIVGRSNPQADPNGYRTLLVWQLAEIYYQQPGLYQRFEAASPKQYIRPKEVDLIPLIQSGEMDYAFNYLSVALQHDLEYIQLPPEINLSDPRQGAFYRQAQVELDGDNPGETILRQGEAIVYGVTIPSGAPNPELGLLFLEFLFSPAGREILTGQGQLPLDPPLSAQVDVLDASLQPLVSPLE